jgi:hypothetical protein
MHLDLFLLKSSVVVTTSGANFLNPLAFLLLKPVDRLSLTLD